MIVCYLLSIHLTLKAPFSPIKRVFTPDILSTADQLPRVYQLTVPIALKTTSNFWILFTNDKLLIP